MAPPQLPMFPTSAEDFLANHVHQVSDLSAVNDPCAICKVRFLGQDPKTLTEHIVDDLESDDQEVAVRLPCGHVFGRTCLENLVKSGAEWGRKCPLDRKPLFEAPLPEDPFDEDEDITTLPFQHFENFAQFLDQLSNEYDGVDSHNWWNDIEAFLAQSNEVWIRASMLSSDDDLVQIADFFLSIFETLSRVWSRPESPHVRGGNEAALEHRTLHEQLWRYIRAHDRIVAYINRLKQELQQAEEDTLVPEYQPEQAVQHVTVLEARPEGRRVRAGHHLRGGCCERSLEDM